MKQSKKINRKGWEKLKMNKIQMQDMYRGWGEFYSTNQPEKAVHYLDLSIQLNPTDRIAWEKSIMCFRSMTDVDSALQRCYTALKNLEGPHVGLDYQLCRTIIELNEFEEAKRLLHECCRSYSGIKQKPLTDLLDLMDESLMDSVSPLCSTFLYKHEKILTKVTEIMRKKDLVDERPLWKVLQEEGKCDVSSHIEKKEYMLPPLEWARRKHSFQIFHQHYLHRNWVDVVFLRHLQNDNNVFFEKSKESAAHLKELLTKNNKCVRHFMNNLHARSPLYIQKPIKGKLNNECLYYTQYNTRRNMITILKTIRYLRSKRDVDRLAFYVQHIILLYVPLKTNRIMPWKFEFMNEVYNTLGLAFMDQLVIPIDINRYENRTRMKIMLQIPLESKNFPGSYVFGERGGMTAKDIDSHDSSSTYRDSILFLESGLTFAKYPVDRIYIWHECSRIYLKQGALGECCSYAQKGLEEATKFNIYLWAFLCNMLMLKANVILSKLERCKELLPKLLELACKLKSHKLQKFVIFCKRINDNALSNRKHMIREVNRKSRTSLKSSRPSQQSLLWP